MSFPRLAVVCDLIEENWPSMDLVGEMLLKHLHLDQAELVAATKICPKMRRRVTRQRAGGRGQEADGRGQEAEGRRQEAGGRGQEAEQGKWFNADRFLNRFWDYPRVAHRIRNDFDLFHLVDHSYGQLLHQLPAERTIVTCHDLDTFQCLLNPKQEPRSTLFKAMMKRTLSGFQKAAFVTCDSVATRDELLSHGIIAPERTAIVPNGVHPSCSPEPNAPADEAAAKMVGVRRAEFGVRRSGFGVGSSGVGVVDILHVGSTIPRKRIEVLLRVFALVRRQFPAARLVRVGGAFTDEQERLVKRLDLEESILVLPHLDREVLAAVYRRAALVLLTSEREGFGLPVVEAMACGTPLVASDLPVLREVGGEVASYCPFGDLKAWTETVCELLTEYHERPGEWTQRQRRSVAQAARFSWAEYAQRMAGIYQKVLSESPSAVYVGKRVAGFAS